jgi:hypothetical protein
MSDLGRRAHVDRAAYVVRPVPRDVAEVVRRNLRDPHYAHPAHAELATSPAPCRVCLRKLEPGREWRIPMTYDPFRRLSERPLPGPIFIHESDCPPYAEDGLPPDLAGDRLTFEVFDPSRERLAETLTADAQTAERTVSELLADDRVAFIHARSTSNGCFLFEIDPTKGGWR